MAHFNRILSFFRLLRLTKKKKKKFVNNRSDRLVYTIYKKCYVVGRRGLDLFSPLPLYIMFKCITTTTTMNINKLYESPKIVHKH